MMMIFVHVYAVIMWYIPEVLTSMYMILLDYVLLCHTLQILRQVNTGDVVLTQIVLSYSGRMMFVGTSSGAVRAVKFPLTDPGEWQEHQVHSAAVSRVSESMWVWDFSYDCIPLYLHVYMYM